MSPESLRDRCCLSCSFLLDQLAPQPAGFFLPPIFSLTRCSTSAGKSCRCCLLAILSCANAAFRLLLEAAAAAGSGHLTGAACLCCFVGSDLSSGCTLSCCCLPTVGLTDTSLTYASFAQLWSPLSLPCLCEGFLWERCGKTALAGDPYTFACPTRLIVIVS